VVNLGPVPDDARWSKIEALYHSAVGLNPGERAAWLSQACDDEAIRQEVLSLLESAENKESFLENPAISLGLAVMSLDDESLVGKDAGRYRVLKKIGHGGMGEVYLARDPRLRRDVALKFLPASITYDPVRVRRFEQEARAASAISHPNVAHVYEIGEAAGRHYISMEYIAGPTLRELLRQRALDQQKILDISIQVGNALAAAHRVGVIHRDIKPENIMMAADGYVKVLDFGLAKSVENPQLSSSDSLHTVSSIHTAPELFMGTSHYMSPEQVRRQQVDPRTDLWSLGIVMFEMLTSRRPFQGDTISEVIIGIIEQEPSFAVSECRSVPIPLRNIVLRTLNKDLKSRYQSADELLSDLRMVQPTIQSISAEPKVKAADAPRPVEVPDRQPFKRETVLSQPHSLRANTIGQRFDTVRVTETPAPLWLGRWKTQTLTLLVGIVLVAAVGYFGLKAMRHAPLVERPVNLRFERLNLAGTIDDITLSPDGKYAAAIVQEEGNYAIHVSELATGSDLRVAVQRSEGYSGLSFSADGTYLYYIENLAYSGVLNRVSKFGGGQRKIADNVNSRPSFSPDGRQMVFTRLNKLGEPADLIVASAEGDSQRILAKRSMSDTDFFFSDPLGPGPVWSPDGQYVACATRGKDSRTASANIELLSPLTGAGRRLSVKPWQDISRMTWLADSSGMVVAAKETRKSPWQLSLLGATGGESRQLTIDPNNYTAITGAADSKSFITINSEEQSNVWFVDAASTSQTVSLMPTNRNGVSEIFWNADSTLVAAARDGSYTNLWLEDLRGAPIRQLTFDAYDHFNPVVSPDRHYILFAVGDQNGTTISRIDNDGSNLMRLTTGPADTMPTIAPDGNWFVYRTAHGLNRASIDGGSATRVWNEDGFSPAVSPNGQLLSFFTAERLDSKKWYLAVIDLRTMSQISRFELPDTTDPFGALRWTPSGDALTYVSNSGGAANIWLQPFKGGRPHQLPDFKEAAINSFAWSPDGKTIACVRRVKVFVPMIVRLY